MNKKIFSKYREAKNYPKIIMDDEVIKLFKDNRLKHLTIIELPRAQRLGGFYLKDLVLVVFPEPFVLGYSVLFLLSLYC